MAAKTGMLQLDEFLPQSPCLLPCTRTHTPYHPLQHVSLPLDELDIVLKVEYAMGKKVVPLEPPSSSSCLMETDEQLLQEQARQSYYQVLQQQPQLHDHMRQQLQRQQARELHQQLQQLHLQTPSQSPHQLQQLQQPCQKQEQQPPPPLPRKYRCFMPHCEFRYAFKSGVWRHLREYHKEGEVFSCPVKECRHAFFNFPSLHRHLIAFHVQTKRCRNFCQ